MKKFDDLFKPENKNRIKNWEQIGYPAIKADMNNSGIKYVGGTQEIQKLAWLWIEYQEYLEEKKNRPSAINKFIYNPWIIAIGSGIIVSLIIAFY